MWRKKNNLGGCIADPILAGLPLANDLTTVGDLELPRSFSLKEQMPFAKEQLNYDCVGCCGAIMGEFFEKNETREIVTFSAMALFSLAKEKDGLPREAGTYLSNATYIPEKYGYFFENDYPEKGGDIYQIKDEYKEDALVYKIKKSIMVDRGSQNYFEGIKRVLYEFMTPVVIGVNLWENFKPDIKGRISHAKGKMGAGHAMLAVGYDDNMGWLEVLNSWGTRWGDHGFCYLPYGYPIFATAWTALDEKNVWNKPKIPVVDHRDLAKEQRNAEILKEAIYKKFAVWDRARGMSGKLWFEMVNAMTYKGYTATDMINYLYFYSRNNKPLFDITKKRANN